MIKSVPPDRRRRRGSRASRIKLNEAMQAAGVKTQAALAEIIADNEKLEQSPKDTINRAFREQPVELRTLNRIARALGVEVETLLLDEPLLDVSAERATANFLSGSEMGLMEATIGVPSSAPMEIHENENIALHNNGANSKSLTPAPLSNSHSSRALDALITRTGSDNAPTHRLRSRGGRALILGALLAAALSAALFIYQALIVNPTEQFAEFAPFRQMQPSLGRFSVAVLAPTHLSPNILETLTKTLSQNFNTNSSALTLLARNQPPSAVAEKYGVDLVISIRQITEGRHVGLQFHLFGNNHEQLIWSESLTLAELESQSHNIAARVHQALQFALNSSANYLHFTDPKSQHAYLRGRVALDRSPEPKQIKLAQAYFSESIRDDTQYGLAYAGLCEALALESWQGDSKRILMDAQEACGRALRLDQWHAYPRVAKALQLRVSGQIDAAIRFLQTTDPNHLGNADLLTELANLHLELFRQNTEKDLLELAQQYARSALDTDPSYWKSANTLGLTYFHQGDTNTALAHFENAAELNPTALAFSNLGTMHFCQGNMDSAQQHFSRAKNLSPSSYLGDEYLGFLHYMKGDFDRAAEHREIAIQNLDNQGNIHAMWGALGDAYKKSARLIAAGDAYKKAVDIIERDYALGIQSAQDTILKAYYLVQLHELQPDAYPLEDIEAHIHSALNSRELVTDTAGLIRFAQICLFKGESELALQTYNNALAICPGYHLHPDLKFLTAQQ